MCNVEDLKQAAARLDKSNPGDAATIRKALKAFGKGRATPQQIAKATKLARGVLDRTIRS